MKRHLFLIPLIFATTAVIADTQGASSSTPTDAQAQAAALLSRPQAIGAAKAEARSPSTSPVSAVLDAHESAAALLSGARPKNRVMAPSAVAESRSPRVSTDAQAQAAALLSGSRTSMGTQVQAKQTDHEARTIRHAL